MAKEIDKKLRHFHGRHFGFRQPLIKTTLFKTTKLRHFRSHPASTPSILLNYYVFSAEFYPSNLALRINLAVFAVWSNVCSFSRSIIFSPRNPSVEYTQLLARPPTCCLYLLVISLGLIGSFPILLSSVLSPSDADTHHWGDLHLPLNFFIYIL